MSPYRIAASPPTHLFGLPAREMLRDTWIAEVGHLVYLAERRQHCWRVGISTAQSALAVGHGPSLEIAERDAERRLRQREQDCRDARAVMRGMRGGVVAHG